MVGFFIQKIPLFLVGFNFGGQWGIRTKDLHISGKKLNYNLLTPTLYTITSEIVWW